MPKVDRPLREALARKRLKSILAAHGIATMRTLEQKISDAGPTNQRIDPHILTTARQQLKETGELTEQVVSGVPWYHLTDTAPEIVATRLALQRPVYQLLNSGTVSLRVGQALEIATYRALLHQETFEFYGRFRDLEAHDDSTLYSKEQPPAYIGSKTLTGKQTLDFMYRHPTAGPLGIECKNVREWLYPDRSEVVETLRKCIAIDCVPVLIVRRFPYVTFLLMNTCGVILHQTYSQLLAAADALIAEDAKHKTLLGYHDIRIGNIPDKRLLSFIGVNLPLIADQARARFNQYKDLLGAFAYREIPYREFAARVRRRAAGQNEDSDLPDEMDYDPNEFDEL